MPVRKINRARRKRRHIGLQVQHRAAFCLFAPTAAGGKLNNHSWAVLTHAFLNAAIQLRIGAGDSSGLRTWMWTSDAPASKA